jgi:hypothetical protein
MAGMRLADKVLVHQVHPLKIGADAMAAVVSDILLWTARPKTALAVKIVLPVAGSLVVFGIANLDALASTRQGAYALQHMPNSAQAVRLAGDALMGRASLPAPCWCHRPTTRYPVPASTTSAWMAARWCWRPSMICAARCWIW